LTAVAARGRTLRKDRYFSETGYIPHEAQWEIHKSAARHRACSNGRRWGKTLLGGKEAEITCFVLNLMMQPQHGWIVGPQYDDGEKEFRVLFNSLRALGVDDLSEKFVKNRENGNMHIHTSWGWNCEVKSAQHPESLVGEGLDWVLLVEAGRLHRHMFTEFIRPALSDKRGWSLATGVPEIATDTSLLYWAYQRGQSRSATNWASWKMPSWTNPIVFPGGEYDEEIQEAKEELTEDEFARQYGGEFVEKVGRVMKEWDDDVHLHDIDYEPGLPLYGAVDFGYTNPWVWLWIQIGPFGQVRVLREHYITLEDTLQIAQNTIKPHPWLPQLKGFYPDPHEPDDTNILSRIISKPAYKSGGDVRTRNALIRTALKRKPEEGPDQERIPQLIVDRSCEKLAWEMREGYRWPRNKSETHGEAELPMDKDNHGPEALGRFMHGYFENVGEMRRARIRRANIRR
jgi:hypothetical protein